MMGRFVRGMLLGVLFVLAVGVWPASASVSSPSVGSPQGPITGHYDSDGDAVGFRDSIRGTASTTCKNGWTSWYFRVTGPGSYDERFNADPPSTNGTWTNPAITWDTRPLLNGVYRVRLNVTEATGGLLTNCDNQSTSAYRDVKVAGAPVSPAWSGAPAAASDGSAIVTLKWNKNAEEDIISYEISRTGPGGTVSAIVPPSVCGSSTCQVQDGPQSFPADYSGTYSYKITAVRSAPDGTGEACGNVRCVKSNSSDIQSVTLTKPTPSPTPTDSPTSGGSPTAKPGGGGSSTGGGSTPSVGGNRGNTRVLSFGGSGGSSYNDFYSGTYDENLPYQPKTLVIGGGQSTVPNARTEAAAFSEDPPNYRTIMLPVAGGLLAFLSAAHVRRLLIHF